MSAVESLSTIGIWLVIIALAISTYALRSSFIALFSYYQMPEDIEDHLTLVPPAVLAALAVPPLVYRDAMYHVSPTNPYVLAGVAAGVVAWKTENLFATFATGFAVFYVVTELVHLI